MFRPSRKEKSSPPPPSTTSDHDVESDESSPSCNKTSASSPSKRSQMTRKFLWMALLFVFTFIALFVFRRSLLSGWWIMVMAVSIPVLMACWVVYSAQLVHQRLIAAAFVGALLCNQLPTYVSAGVAALSLTLFGLATRPQPVSTTTSSSVEEKKTTPSTSTATSSLDPRTWSGKVRAVASALLLVVVLLTDNFFVWVVAATYYPSHEKGAFPTPLQDNGRLVQTWMFQTILGLTKRDVQQLRALFNIQWALVSSLGATLVCCELNLTKSGRTLWGVCLRALCTLSAARVVRVISFLLTVLPSQFRNCYINHFPSPPPSDWFNWMLVGMTPQSHGGCNDLIVSGHATVTAIMACASTSVVGSFWFSLALWTLLAMDYCVEVYEGFHYSVDMWMGALITSMLWRILGGLEERESGTEQATKRLPLSESTSREVIKYALPATLAYMIVMIFPESVVNYWVLGYFSWAVVETLKVGFSQYTQHVLLCTMYIALAVYL